MRLYWDALTEHLERGWQGELKLSGVGVRAEGPSYRKITFLAQDWCEKKEPRSDGFVCGELLIFMQQIGRKERSFLVKQEANLWLKQFSLRLLQLLRKMSCKISCMYNSHTHTHTRAAMQQHVGGGDGYTPGEAAGSCRTVSFRTLRECRPCVMTLGTWTCH